MTMSEELELAGDEKGPWIWKAAIVALPVGLALSAGVAMFLKVTRAEKTGICLLYTSPSPRDQRGSRMPSSA